MSRIVERLRNEPAMVRTVLLGAVSLAAGFGFELDPELLSALFTVFAVLTGVDIRRKVSPVDAGGAAV